MRRNKYLDDLGIKRKNYASNFAKKDKILVLYHKS